MAKTKARKLATKPSPVTDRSKYPAPPLPAPIDPKQPVPGVAAWLDCLGSMALAYTGARQGIAVIVRNEVRAAHSAAMEYAGVHARTRPQKELEAARFYDSEAAYAKATIERIPLARELADGVERCTAIVEPFLPGLSKYLATLPKGQDPARFVTELRLAVRELKERIAVDRLCLDGGYIPSPDGFISDSKILKEYVSGVCTRLHEKASYLASIEPLPKATADVQHHDIIKPKRSPNPDLLLVQQVADICRRSKGRITQLCNEGKIDHQGKGVKRRVSLISAQSYFASTAQRNTSKSDATIARNTRKDAKEIDSDTGV